MGLLGSVSKFAQKVIVGDGSRKRKHEPPAMRMIITEEPRPSHQEQVRAWMNGGNQIPDRAQRMHQRIEELHHTDYLAFPEGEGTLGIHSVKGFKKNPHNVDQFYNEPMFKSNKKRRN